MKINKFVSVVDSHTCGEPTRVVLSGAPMLKGNCMTEKWMDFKKNYDAFRRFIMTEPRGHASMFGAIIVPPVNPKADIGVIFCDTGGSVSMCGHGAIGVSTVIVNLGLVKVNEPETYITLDTPVGLVVVCVQVVNGEAVSATIQNVPSFVFARDCELYIPSILKNVRTDICFGGNFFVIVDAKDFSFDLVPEEVDEVKKIGLEILDIVNKKYAVQHPLYKDNNKILLTEFSLQKENGVYRNCVVFGDGNVDRSPCGTGTCAKMALLAAKGQLKEGEVFLHESILNTVFEGVFMQKTKVGNFDAIMPLIKGNASVTGFNLLICQERDSLKHGFLL